MATSAVVWKNPDLGETVLRASLLRRLSQCGTRPVVFSAAAQAGKTTAMAQLVRDSGWPVAWIWCEGLYTTPDSILEVVLDALKARPTRESDCEQGSGLFIALDDVRLTGGSELATLVSSLVQTLPEQYRVALTTRTRFDAVRPPCAAFVVNDAALAFDAAEAAAFLEDSRVSGTSLEESLVASHGNAGCLTQLLAATCGRQDSASWSEFTKDLVRLCRDESEEKAFITLAMVRQVDSCELTAIGDARLKRSMEEVAKRIPMFYRDTSPSFGCCFRAHPAVAEAALLILTPRDATMAGVSIPLVLGFMKSSGRWEDITRILHWAAVEPDVADWLSSSAKDLIATMGHHELLSVLAAIPIGLVICRPRLMLWWATALYESGDVGEALAKSSVAANLAEHEHDSETSARAKILRIRCLLVTGDMDRCMTSAESLWRLADDSIAPDLSCELLMLSGFARMVVGRIDEGRAHFEKARTIADATPSAKHLGRRCKRLLTALDCYWTGEWAHGGRELAKLMDEAADGFTEHAALIGSTAISLMETGRLQRAAEAFGSVLARNDSIDAAYSPFDACVALGLGDTERAQALIEHAFKCAKRCGDRGDIHATEVLQSITYRVAGCPEKALDIAEQAYESFSSSDYLGFRRLALCEVSASLLAIGDVPAARMWIGLLERTDNPYHGLRAAMILSECDRRDGDLESGIARLVEFADHIRSENSNWQMAMYVRTFPHLLGMLGRAVGAKNLPAHMLRMILPENAEACLRASKSMLDDGEFRLLGDRLLGQDQFAEFLDRKGRPICRVRMFGGLEVASGDRQVLERDWSKRKARLLFAMLVARRGHDVPRDTILDHLWPDMDEERAKNNFYVAWSSMKSALMSPETRSGKCPYIDNARGRCRVIAENVRSDVDEFESLVSKARGAEAEGRRSDALDAYAGLTTVYRGDLLPGDLYDDWFSTLRDKYRFEFVEAMLRASRLAEPSDALVFLRRGLDVDPYREDLYQASLSCQIASGRRSAAIETFIQCKTYLADELGLDPSAETMALYQKVLVMEEKQPYDPYELGEIGS